MYALISVYDDTNKCIYKNNALTPNMVNHDGEYTTYKFGFSITIAEDQAPTMNGKFKHDDIPDILDEPSSDKSRFKHNPIPDIPEPEVNKWIDQEVENGKNAADDFVNKLDNGSQSVKWKCMICGKITRDDKIICDKCYEVARREGLLL